MNRIVDTVIFYQNEEEVFAYAKEVSKQTAVQEIALVIVVNKKGDTEIADFKRKLETLPMDIYLYDPNENLGYLNGVIYGYQQYCIETQSIPEWVVVSNTDIEFRNKKFFEDFLRTGYEKEVWCVAPSVYNPVKNSYDNPEYIERCSKNKIDRLIYFYERPTLAFLYENAAKIKGKLGRNEKLDSQFIYSAKGCFFIIRNEMAALLNDRKYKALLYSEESYVAEIIRSLGKKIYYDSDIEVIHNESAVTGKLQIEQKAKYIADSLKIIREEFYE
jgi:GT2 family glycosyltransferase